MLLRPEASRVGAADDCRASNRMRGCMVAIIRGGGAEEEGDVCGNGVCKNVRDAQGRSLADVPFQPNIN